MSFEFDQLCAFLYLSLDFDKSLGPRFSQRWQLGTICIGCWSLFLSSCFISRLMLPEEPPSAPPKNIVASGRTNQSIMVQWQPPPETEHNGVLRGYILRQVTCVWPFLDCHYKESGVCFAGVTNSKVSRSPTVIKRIWPVSDSREW